MDTNYSHNVVIFLNSTFYNDSIHQIIEPFTANQSTVIYLFNILGHESITLPKFMDKPNIKIEEITKQFVPPTLSEETLIIDALFGFENQEPLSGGFAAVTRLINSSSSTVLSIGAPSGLLNGDNTNNNPNQIVRANYTLLIEEAPLACYFDENQQFLGQWSILPLKQKPQAENNVSFITEEQVVELIKPRKRFCHKGTFGHGLLIAGSYGMAGACSLGAKAALKSGLGLLSLHVPAQNRIIHQTTVPEAIVDSDSNELCFSQLLDTTPYNAVAVGPGLGMAEETDLAFAHLISQNRQSNTPLIIDADGLNALSNYTELQNQIAGAILTPQVGEIERLIGKCNNSYIRLRRTIEFARKTQTYILLKGSYSFIIFPDGDFFMNPTGTSGMATAGSGDVLTGILLGLRTQGYSAKDTLIIGAYVHGRAGELAAQKLGTISMTANDIVDNLSFVWKELEQKSEEMHTISFV
jgi:ADP-dependent NAD(P)H-hydrate dehydratase / NAD(P)H-hydrate epimerase